MSKHTTNNTHAKDYEIIFDNGGSATLQRYDGQVVIHYTDMHALAQDAYALLHEGVDPICWGCSDLELFINNDKYEENHRSGGYLSISLNPEYVMTWFLSGKSGWNNFEIFRRLFKTFIPKDKLAEYDI